MAIGIVAGLASHAAEKFLKKGLTDEDRNVIADVNVNSLAELARLTDIEAITAIDSSLTIHESTTDVLKYINSLWAGWYLSSAQIMTDTGRIKTVKLLERLNPAKNPSYAIANNILSGAGFVYNKYSGESIGLEGLPVAVEEKLPTMLPVVSNFSFEAKDEAEKAEKSDKPIALQSSKETNNLTTVSNLSVGQSVTLTLNDNGATKDITVNLRLVTVPVNAGVLKTILTWSQKDLRLKSRLSAWRAGELRFWRDVILMRDVFTERQKVLMNDKSDLLQAMLGRQSDSMVHSVMTLTPSVGTMSSVLVISADRLRDLELNHSDGRLSDVRFRQRVMNATGLMIIAVVDPMSEFVKIYTHTQALASEFSIKQLKVAGKGGASDLGEIIKLMNQNQVASF